MKNQILATILASLALSACATPYEAKEIETKLELKGRTSDSKIGLNSKGQVIVQTEKHADVELQSQELANYYFAEQIRWAIYDIQSCREELSTTGEVQPAPEIEVPDEMEGTEEFGLDEQGELKIVTKELFVKKLRAEKVKTAKLTALLKEAKRLDRKCQLELRAMKRRTAQK